MQAEQWKNHSLKVKYIVPGKAPTLDLLNLSQALYHCTNVFHNVVLEEGFQCLAES